MAEGDNLPDPLSAPYPYGEESLVWFEMGGRVDVSVAAVIDTLYVPFDCYNAIPRCTSRRARRYSD